MRSRIIPTLLTETENEFREKLRLIERVAPLVHIDVMDGKFVANTTWADPLVVEKMKTPARFEVHLMVEEPFREVILWGKLARVQRTIVHVEATTQLRTLLHTIRATGKEVGLAVNPGTPLRNIITAIELASSSPSFRPSRSERRNLRSTGISRLRPPRADSARDDAGGDVDALLVMANEPGFSGRPFLPATLRRIASLRKQFPTLPIGVDIGVNLETTPKIRKAGATFACAGSAIFGAPDPVAAYRALERAFTRAPR